MGPKNQKILIFSVALLALIVYFAVRISSEDEESRLRKTIYTAAVAVESRDVGRCSRFVAPEYADNYGNNKFMLLSLISGIFKDYEDIKVDIRKINIEIDGVKADAGIGFKCYFKPFNEDKIYYDAAKLNIKFKKENKLWKAVEIEYIGSNEILYIQAVA